MGELIAKSPDNVRLVRDRLALDKTPAWSRKHIGQPRNWRRTTAATCLVRSALAEGVALREPRDHGDPAHAYDEPVRLLQRAATMDPPSARRFAKDEVLRQLQVRADFRALVESVR